jgi:hypothetical protein
MPVPCLKFACLKISIGLHVLFSCSYSGGTTQCEIIFHIKSKKFEMTIRFVACVGEENSFSPNILESLNCFLLVEFKNL